MTKYVSCACLMGLGLLFMAASFVASPGVKNDPRSRVACAYLGCGLAGLASYIWSVWQ